MKGYKIYSIVLLIALLSLGTGVIVDSAIKEEKTEEYQTLVYNNYERSFNDLRYAVSNVGLNLSKFAVVKSNSERGVYLGKVVRFAEMAADAISDFSSDNSLFTGLRKFFSQTADYCETSIRQLSSGKELGVDVMQKLNAMRTECEKIEDKLSSAERSEKSLFEDIADVNSQIGLTFTELESSSMEYPSLIYDGPFSDSLVNQDATGVFGEEYDKEQAKEKVKEMFSVSDVEYTGESDGKIPAWFFKFEKQANYVLQVSKKGCHIVQFTAEKQLGEKTLTAEQCAEIGLRFLSDLGYSNMTDVWASEYDGAYYVNYCSLRDDVIVYPEMIKLKITADDGTVTGMECLNYLHNFPVQFDAKRSADFESIIASLQYDLVLQFARYALIPLNAKQIMTIEVCAKQGEDIYFIYYDVETGDEVNVLKVIDSDAGRLLK